MTRAYESSNGDTWDLVYDEATNETRVRHTPNLASGGQGSEVALANFLTGEPRSPQQQAVAALVGGEGGSKRNRAIVGYVHDPKEDFGPYIAVVFRPEGEPTVTLHKSRADADRELQRRLTDLRQTSLTRLRGDEMSKRP